MKVFQFKKSTNDDFNHRLTTPINFAKLISLT